MSAGPVPGQSWIDGVVRLGIDHQRREINVSAWDVPGRKA